MLFVSLLRSVPCTCLMGVLGIGMAVAQSGRMSSEKAKALKNPMPYSKESASEGRKAYLRLCQACHGMDGKALANPDFEAPDLTNPKMWSFGTSDGEIFVSIRDGAGHDMPPFKSKLKDEQIWTIVNYIRGIGPAEHRPNGKG